MPFWISILIIGTFPLCFPSTQKTRVDVVPGTFPLRMGPRCALSLATSASTRQVLVGAFKMIFLFSCICILSIRWHVLAPAIEDDTLYSGYGEDQGKEDFSNVQLQKWLRGVSRWKHLCIFCWNCDFTFFEVSSTTVLDLSWMFRSRYTLTVDNVETHERLSSGFMVSKNNFKVLLSTIFTDEAFFL